MTPCNKFPKRLRLKSSRTIQEIFQSGTRITGKFVNLYFLPSDSQQMAVTISRKTGNAVYRNRQKRRVREAWRTHRHLFPPDVIVVLHIKKVTPEPTFQDYRRDLERLGSKIRKRRVQRETGPEN